MLGYELKILTVCVCVCVCMCVYDISRLRVKLLQHFCLFVITVGNRRYSSGLGFASLKPGEMNRKQSRLAES